MAMKKSEVYALLEMYKKKLDNFIEKRDDSIIVFDEGTSVSSYNKVTKKITLTRDNTRVRYHELGHSLWYKTGKKTIHGLGKFEEEFPINSVLEAQEFLDMIIWDYHCNSVEDVIPISDYLGLLLDERIPDFHCHNQGYWKKRGDVWSNEFTANICGLIGSLNYKGFLITMELMAEAVYGVLDLIDKAMNLSIQIN